MVPLTPIKPPAETRPARGTRDCPVRNVTGTKLEARTDSKRSALHDRGASLRHLLSCSSTNSQADQRRRFAPQLRRGRGESAG